MGRKPVVAALFFCLLVIPLLGFPPPLRGEMRDVRVKVVADEEWRRDPDWIRKAEAGLGVVSADFERSFEIRLLPVKFGAWDSDDSVASMEKLANGLDSGADREGCDVLIALTAQPNLSRGLLGYSLFREGLVMVRAAGDAAGLARTLKHEIGHLFGAVHIPRPASVMDVFLQGTDFDDLNREAVKLVRGRLFNTVEFPIPKPVRPAAIELYARICAVVESSELRRKPGRKDLAAARESLDENGPGEAPDLDDAHLLLAQICIEEKRYDDAARACRAGLKIRPGDLEAQNLLGIIDRKQGRIDEAIRKYQAVLKADPSYPRVHYNLGIAYAKKGDLGSAQAAYEKAVELRPRSAEAHNNLGETLLRRGNIGEAEKELGLAVSLDPRYALALANLADLALRKGDLAEARERLDKALTIDPEIPSAWTVSGNLASREGRPAEAAQRYLRAVAIDPEYDKGWFNLGVLQFGMNEPGQARASFEKAVGINPRFAEAHASLGCCLIKQGRVDEGVAEILAAEKLGFHSAITHLNLSFAYITKDKLDDAIAEAERAIALDASQPLAYNNLGIAFTKKGMLSEAERQFEKAVRADPRCRDGWLNLANVCYQTGRADLALGHLLEAFKLGPKDGALCNNIAVLYFRKEEYRAALEYAEKAEAAGFKVDPDFLAAIKKRLSGAGGT